MKACLIRFGIRNFKPTLRKAPEGLEALRTPEGAPLPPNTRAEMRRDMARLRFVQDQIKKIEATRLQRLQQLEQAPAEGPHAMIRLLARVTDVGIEKADMLVNEILARNFREQKGCCSLRWAHRFPGRKRQEKQREGIVQGRQRSCSPRDDSTRLALSHIPKGKRARTMVSCSHKGRSRRHPQDHDRRIGAKASHSAVAYGDDWRDAGRSRDARNLSANARK
jgi:transposase